MHQGVHIFAGVHPFHCLIVHILDCVPITRETPGDLGITNKRIAMAVQHDLRLERQDRVERFNPIKGPSRLRAANRIKVGKRIRLWSGNAKIVVPDEYRLVFRDPNRQMIRGLSRRAEQIKLYPTQCEFVALIKQNVGFRPFP